jgi:competence protein ComEC
MSEVPAARKINLYPLVLLAAAFAIGILLDTAIQPNPRMLIAGIVSPSVLAALYKDKAAGTVLVAAAFMLLGSWCSHVERASVGEDRIRTLIDTAAIPSRSPVVLEGTLTTPPEPTSEGFISTVNVQKINYRGQTLAASGRVRLYLLQADDAARSEYSELDLRYGSNVSIACEIEREEQYQNPGVASRIQLMERQSIDAVATIKSPLVIENLGDDSVFLPLAWVYDIRESILEQFHKRFSSATAGVLAASMLGDKYFLDKPTADIFREGGTFHVLVISGLHITFIGGLLLLVVSAFARNRLLRFVIVSAALWAYALSVGGEAPVVRACMMFTILLFSTVVDRQGSLLNSLGACVIVLLVWRPSDLFNPSLQLTLLSVVAIVGMAFPLIEKLRSVGAWMPSTSTPFPPNVPTWLLRLCEMIYWNPAAWQIESARQIWSARIAKSPYLPVLIARGGQKMVAYIVEGLLVSLIVQMWLLPLLIFYFHRITPVSIAMNLWVGVVIAIESFSALLAVLIGSFSEFLAAPFFSLTEFFNYLLSSAPAGFVGGNWSSWRVPNYSGAWSCLYVFYFVPLITLMVFVWKWGPFEIWKLRSRTETAGIKLQKSSLTTAFLALSILFAGVLVFHPFSAPRADGRLHIDFLDVGQGDSALVIFPDGTTMLIDGGGRMEFRKNDDDDPDTFVPDTPGIGEAVVSPVLWKKGYSRVDYIVATHADADHIQGLTDVAANFEIGEALFGREPTANPEFSALKSVLDRRHVPGKLISRGQRMNFGGATVEILFPLLDASPDAPSDNNHSVVVRIVYGNRAFLLTGDIESEAENALINGGGALKADVIKVPHHGSRTSSTPEFVSRVEPEFAIISVGRHSRFGHPHKDIIERWRDSGSQVMTTGENGMISVSTDGKDLTLHSFLDIPDNE